MRGKVKQVDYNEDQYGFTKPLDEMKNSKRLDVNDLLQRAKNEKKIDKKINLMVLSGAISVVLVLFIILSY